MPFQRTRIPFSAAGSFPKLFLDYVNDRPELRPFYSYRPDLSSFEKAIADLSSFSFNRSMLVDTIREQYTKGGIASIPEGQIKLLGDTNTYTVTTGHQLCLFTGPLYFIYKIISTIQLTEALKKKYPKHNFIPVYWMASEDHDVEEVNHAFVFGKKITWNTTQKGAVGRFDTTSLSDVITELKGIIGESENAKGLITLFESAYLKNKNLADATRALVHQLFGKQGLLIINGDDVRLKIELVDILHDDIFNQTNFKTVSSSIEKLEALGYKAQVNPREINVFLLSENDRTRIEDAGKLAGRQELAKHPEDFSPNVVLRPLFQQKILPNIAYVGGPGELSYWLEYKAMFDQQKLFFPVLVPRSSIMLFDKRMREQLAKFGLNEETVFTDTETLVKEFAEKNSGSDLSLDAETEKLRTIYSEISAKAVHSDKTLKAAAEAELQKTINGIKSLENKMLKAEKQKQETVLNQLRKLKEKLFPGGALQERQDNFIAWYLQHGNDLFRILKENSDPLSLELTVLKEE